MKYKYCLLAIIFLLLFFSITVSARDSKQNDFKKSSSSTYASKNDSREYSANLFQNDFSIFRKPWRINTTEQRTFSVLDKDILYRFTVKVYYIDENKFKLWLEPDEPKVKYLFSKAANPISVSSEPGCEAYYFDYGGGYTYCDQTCGSSEYDCFTSPPPLKYLHNGFISGISTMCDSCSFKQKTINEYKASCEDPYCCNDLTYTYCNPNIKYGQLIYSGGVNVFKPVGDKLYYCAYLNMLPKDGQCGVQPSCSSGWKCKDGSNKAYQNSDCSWGSVTYCSNGCSNGECNSPPNIICNKDEDCGTDGYIGMPFCNNNTVSKNYKYFSCNNAGTPSANCSSNTFEETIEACGTKQCVNGSCVNTGKCSKNSDCGTDGYTGNKFCKNGSAYQQYKTYKCNNAGQNNASCSNSAEDKFVQQCDYGCENGKCKAVIIECTSGVCCDIAAGKYKPKTEICSTSFNYFCEGNKVMKQEDKKYCSGNNTGCNGSTVSSSSLVETCNGNESCSNGECIEQPIPNFCANAPNWAPNWCSDVEKTKEDSSSVEYEQSFKWDNAHMNAFKALNSDYQWQLGRTPKEDDVWDYLNLQKSLNDTDSESCHGNYYTNLPAPHTDAFSEEYNLGEFFWGCPIQTSKNLALGLLGVLQDNEEFEVKQEESQKLQANETYWVSAVFTRKNKGLNTTIASASQYCFHNNDSLNPCNCLSDLKPDCKPGEFESYDMLTKGVVS